MNIINKIINVLSEYYTPSKKNNPERKILTGKSKKKKKDDLSIKSSKPLTEKEKKERCSGILKYWQEMDMIKIPEVEAKGTFPVDKYQEKCHVDIKKGNRFLGITGEDIAANNVNMKGSLLIMFQCHRAVYFLNDDERQPNYEDPRTYLIAKLFTPTWNNDEKELYWQMDSGSLTIVNSAAVRAFYYKCPSFAASSMPLKDWLSEREENIKEILNQNFGTNNFNNEDFLVKIKDTNRSVSSQFWPDEASREYIQGKCKPIDTSYEETDKPSTGKGEITFRWRFSYHVEGLNIFPPTFQKDLSWVNRLVDKDGVDGISKPLGRYLLGNKSQIEIKEATNNGGFYLPLTNTPMLGRWVANPDHGLSLLQVLGVNISKKVEENPIVAINGPPGTGKTTLLKEIIADRFVMRTQEISALFDFDKGIFDKNISEIVMKHSMIVASSNNKAVENISRELPSIASVDEKYKKDIKHFSDVSNDGEWGLFCAVLGKFDNRKLFKEILKKLKLRMDDTIDDDPYYLTDMKDIFYDTNKMPELEGIIKKLISENKMKGLFYYIEKSAPYKKPAKKRFFDIFIDGLKYIENKGMEFNEFSEKWMKIIEGEEQEWAATFNWFKSDWCKDFKSSYVLEEKKELKDKLISEKKEFNSLNKEFLSLPKDKCKKYNLCEENNLTTLRSYKNNRNVDNHEEILQIRSPFGSSDINDLRSKLFISALSLNEAILNYSAFQFEREQWSNLNDLIDGKFKTNESPQEHTALWSMLFLFFPVISTTLDSAQQQFKQMEKKEGFGLVMIDEAGQAIAYKACGLLQRSRQAILVGDPIQVKPIVEVPKSIDLTIAKEFIPISTQDNEKKWGDDYLIASTSAQTVADLAGNYMSRIGNRKVGIPLLVHRRCDDPMFSISNKIAYDNKMIQSNPGHKTRTKESGWINISENPSDIKKPGYFNTTEANAVIEIIKDLTINHREIVSDGVYIISPFKNMAFELEDAFKKIDKNSNKDWLNVFLECNNYNLDSFAKNNIGTVHTFQGKESSTVIFCLAASSARGKAGGITWVNGEPNILNVAITRAKNNLFVVGNLKDWSLGLSYELSVNNMVCYNNLEDFKSNNGSRKLDNIWGK